MAEVEHIKTKFNDHVTGDACLQYITKDIGLLSHLDWDGSYPTILPQYGFINHGIIADRAFQSEDTGASSVAFSYSSDVIKISNNKEHRLIGLVTDEWTDGSFRVVILGNDDFSGKVYQANTRYTYYVSANPCERAEGTTIFHGNAQEMFVYGTTSGANVPYCFIEDYDADEDSQSTVSLENIFEYVPTIRKASHLRGSLFGTGGHGNTLFRNGGSRNLTVTNDKNNTLTIGNKFNDLYMCFDYARSSPYNMLSGNMYSFFEWLSSLSVPAVNTFLYMEGGTSYATFLDPAFSEDIAQTYETTTLQTIPVNLILTKNESFALNYLNNGTVPPDAFLFPFDWENIPQNTPTQEDEPEPPSGGDDPDNGETSPSGIDGDPTVDGDPKATPQKANNNNTYWLQVGQLQAFINWFWTQAGEIIDLKSLWDRIAGLYNDLGSAVLMVRYFPVNKLWIGGTETVNKIIVGMVEQENVSVEKLLKNNPQKITIGTQAISPQYNSFADYSPYTELMIYLPFHGWLTLDVDIFMGNSVRVKGVYDYMSGTLQYLIYVVSGNSEYLVNSCIVKMCVDIPITLQSKNDRDSAIFNNVTNAMGNLLGAGASVATMNPIGLVMSTANMASGGTASAPLKMIGTQGETGSYYAPNKCAIYMKRPSYNRPKLYKSRVGYPCNQGCYLGSGANDGTPIAKGFTTVYNPTIKFSGNTYGGKVIKPLQSEVDEIYEYLEKGVIL